MRVLASLHDMRVLVAVCLLLLLTGTGCASATARPAQARRLVYGLTEQPAGFDPHLHRNFSAGIPLRQVYDTLLYRHPVSRELVPGLALQWSFAPDGLSFTLQLRENVVFHDGSAFNATAVAVNLARILAPENSVPGEDVWRQRIIRFEVIDDYRIRLVLSEPWSPLPDALSQPGFAIASPAALEAWSTTRYQYHQVGSGPFVFEEYVPGERIVLRRNREYAWGPEFYGQPGENAVDVIEFRFYHDEAERTRALQTGEVQMMGGLQPPELRLLDDVSGVNQVAINVPGQPLQFMMNIDRFPTNLRALRQALIFSTNRGAIANETGQQVAPVAWGPLAESTLFAFSAMRGLYALDSTQAERLLEATGFQDADGDGWLEFEGAPFQLDLLVPPRESIPELAELLREQWRIPGIRTKLIPVPTAAAMREAVNTGDYNLVAAGAPGLDPAWLVDYFVTDGPLNWSGVSDPELDGVLRDALVATEERTRFSLYARAQQIIMDNALILPLRERVNLVAVADGLAGLAWDASGLIPLLHNVAWVSPSAES